MHFPIHVERRRPRSLAMSPVQWRARMLFGQARPSPSIEAFSLLLFAVMMMLAAVLFSLEPARSQEVQLVKVDVAIVAKGFRVSRLIGAPITNDKNDRIGKIDDIIVDQKNVLFAILQVGGFLGIGAHLVAVPYESLLLDESGRKIKLPGASKEQLKSLSEFKYQS
jgi:hypothetical protein